ncbi:unnamed protein product [Cyclocybe aegerita]|uniref:Protein kinase domain-containing protein n=1 Tax=Cyclocybe aegerita TaxID=1973307 RepID=A0A8S0W3T4_CYCAE|nr:unnamed protein product [Cyclocybe aegerita]
MPEVPLAWVIEWITSILATRMRDASDIADFAASAVCQRILWHRTSSSWISSGVAARIRCPSQTNAPTPSSAMPEGPLAWNIVFVDFERRSCSHTLPFANERPTPSSIVPALVLCSGRKLRRLLVPAIPSVSFPNAVYHLHHTCQSSSTVFITPDIIVGLWMEMASVPPHRCCSPSFHNHDRSPHRKMEQLQLKCFYPAQKPRTVVIPNCKDACVAQLLEEIHGKLKQRIPEFKVAMDDLSLYKADLPSNPYEDLDGRARQWILDHQSDELHPQMDINELFQSPPSQGITHILVADPELRHELAMQPRSVPLAPEYEQLIMTTSARGQVTLQDLEDNGIVEESSPDSRIVEFQGMLETPPRYEGVDLFKYVGRYLRDLQKTPSSSPQPQVGVVPATEDLCALGRKFISTRALPYFPSVPNDSTNSDPNDSTNPDPNNGTAPNGGSNARECSLQEIAHVHHVLFCDFSQKLGAGEKGHYGELQAYAAVFSPFGYSLAAFRAFQIGYHRTDWPFSIFIKTGRVLYSYKPRSDFQFSPATFPVFLAEIQSQTNMKDDNRMKLQAAALLRFANGYLKKHKENKTFFLVTAYINSKGILERRIFYQDQDQGPSMKVKYTAAKAFELTEKPSHLSFLCELYNLASWAAKNVLGNNAQDEKVQIQALDEALSKKPPLEGWTSTKKTSRKAPDGGFEGEGRPTQRARGAGGAGDESQLAEQLEALGYQVEPLVFEDASGVWERLDQRQPSTIRTVYEQSDVERTNPLIAKRARKSSQELEILQHLRAQSSPSQYIVALFHHVAIGDTTYLIFPSLEPISEESLRGGRIQQPCQSLVAGVGYLHKHGVAHLDLKPDNLLYDARTRELKIIDFDIAVLVENEEQEVEGYRGTRGWTAPEVRDGRRYSAVRADRWACGRILKWFLRYTGSGTGRGLWNLACQLLAESPRDRPSLIGWCQADSGVLGKTPRCAGFDNAAAGGAGGAGGSVHDVADVEVVVTFVVWEDNGFAVEGLARVLIRGKEHVWSLSYAVREALARVYFSQADLTY